MEGFKIEEMRGIFSKGGVAVKNRMIGVVYHGYAVQEFLGDSKSVLESMFRETERFRVLCHPSAGTVKLVFHLRLNGGGVYLPVKRQEKFAKPKLDEITSRRFSAMNEEEFAEFSSQKADELREEYREEIGISEGNESFLEFILRRHLARISKMYPSYVDMDGLCIDIDRDLEITGEGLAAFADAIHSSESVVLLTDEGGATFDFCPI